MLWCDEKVDPPQPSLDTLLISRPMSEPEELDLFGDPEMMALFIELHNGNPREGPGDDESTLRALAAIPELPERPDILDVGCGPGMQTLALAEATGGNITAFDYFPQFLDQLKTSAAERGIHGRINTVQGDMNNLPFEPGSFDLIWSEGAIYIMGFTRGLKTLKSFVKAGGHVAVSEAVWLKPDPPEEVLKFWEEYPEIDTVEEKIKVINELCYTYVGNFVLPHESWSKDYYDHLERRADLLEENWKAEPEEVQRIIQEARNEIKVFREYHDYYGYCFFVMKRSL